MKYILIPFLSLLLGSCLELKESFTINADGSAKVTLHYSIPKSYKVLVDDTEAVINKDAGSKSRRRSLSRFFNKAKAEAYFSQFRGVALDTYMTYQQDDRLNTYLVLLVKDLDSSLKKGFLPGHTYAKVKDKYSFSWHNPLPFQRLSASKELQASLKDLKIELSLNAPGKVVATNGKDLEDQLIWNFKAEDLFVLKEKEFFAQWLSPEKTTITKLKKPTLKPIKPTVIEDEEDPFDEDDDRF